MLGHRLPLPPKPLPYIAKRPRNFPTSVGFAERVAYQRAIEDIYGVTASGQRAARSQAVALCGDVSGAARKESHSYLRKSQALEDYWQRPITAEQLQAEMDRMAQNTRQPEVLQELFEALGNDPFVIAECLARPVLAERLLRCTGESSECNNRAERRIRSRGRRELHPSRISDPLWRMHW